MQSSNTPMGTSKAAPTDSNFRQAHVEAFVPPKTGTAGYSVPNDFEDDSDGEQDSDEYGSEDSGQKNDKSNVKKQQTPIN